MTEGITWCSGLRCYKKNDCGRFVGLLKEKMEQSEEMPKIAVNVAQFADQDGVCGKFLQKNEVG